MAISAQSRSAPLPGAGRRQAAARRHLWLHFTRMGGYWPGSRDPGHRARRGLLRLRRARPALPRRRCRRCSASTPATAGASSPPPPRRRSASWTSSRTGATPTRGRSSSPSGSPRSPRRAWSACSSRPAARRRSSRRGSSRAPTTACAASRARTKIVARELAYHGTLARSAGRDRPARAQGRLRAASCPAPATCPNTYELPLAGGPRPAVGGRRDRGADRRRGARRPSRR